MIKNSNTFKTMVALLCSFGLAACSTVDTGEESSAASTSANDDLPYIGILQLTSHPALDAISEGVIDQLEKAGYIDGETAVIDLQNGQGDQSNLQSMTERFLANEADILVGIATPAAQTLANATQEIPIILGAVTDPIAANLVDSLETPGKNITGVSDKIPVEAQFDLIKELLPDIKTIGFLYSSSEDNSLSSAIEAEKVANSLGIEVITKTITSANDVTQIAESLAKEVDAIWVPLDNTVATSTATLISIADAHSIPVFPSVDTMVEEGGLATVGLNQYNIGIQTGEVTVAVLEGEDPSQYAIQSPNETETILNLEKALQLNIEVPDSIKDTAIIME